MSNGNNLDLLSVFLAVSAVQDAVPQVASSLNSRPPQLPSPGPSFPPGQPPIAQKPQTPSGPDLVPELMQKPRTGTSLPRSVLFIPNHFLMPEGETVP